MSEHPLDQLWIIIRPVPAIVPHPSIFGEARRGALAPEGFDHGAQVEHGLIAVGVAAERPDRQSLELAGGLGFVAWLTRKRKQRAADIADAAIA